MEVCTIWVLFFIIMVQDLNSLFKTDTIKILRLEPDQIFSLNFTFRIKDILKLLLHNQLWSIRRGLNSVYNGKRFCYQQRT